MATRLRRVALDRLIRYYRYLADLTARQPTAKTITSAQLGTALDVDASQVRKDFSSVGLLGVSRVGYEICEVCRAIRTALGFDRSYEAILVGVGHLGAALLAYDGFERYGLRFTGAFDSDPEKVGDQFAGHTIEPMERLQSFIAEREIRVAVLTIPVDSAQQVADQLIRAGIRILWNFTPTRLSVPAGVFVRNEHISVGLGQIAYQLTLIPNGKPRTRAAATTPVGAPCP